MNTSLHFAIYSSSLGNYFFQEIRDLIAAGLKELGHTAESRDECAGFARNADWHLVVAPHEFYQLGAGEALGRRGGPANLILFNTEQPSTQWFALAAKHFPRAAALWDIDYESALRMRKEGYPAHFLPLGYAAQSRMFQDIVQLPRHAGTERISSEIAGSSCLTAPLASRPFDILFLGHSSARREKFFTRHAAALNSFHNYFHKSNVAKPLIPGQTTHMDTDTSIGLAQRSKVLLNVHHGVDVYFEWHRIVLLGIAQRTLVVTEPCTLAPPFRANVDFVQAPLNELPDRIAYYLRDGQGKAEAQAIVDHGFQTLKQHCRISDALRPLIARLRDPSTPEPVIRFPSSQPTVRPPVTPTDRPINICVVTHDLGGDGREAESGAGQAALAEFLAASEFGDVVAHAGGDGHGRSIGFWMQ